VACKIFSLQASAAGAAYSPIKPSAVFVKVPYNTAFQKKTCDHVFDDKLK